MKIRNVARWHEMKIMQRKHQLACLVGSANRLARIAKCIMACNNHGAAASKIMKVA
jgi:hypothetical protein